MTQFNCNIITGIDFIFVDFSANHTNSVRLYIQFVYDSSSTIYKINNSILIFNLS